MKFIPCLDNSTSSSWDTNAKNGQNLSGPDKGYVMIVLTFSVLKFKFFEVRLYLIINKVLISPLPLLAKYTQ